MNSLHKMNIKQIKGIINEKYLNLDRLLKSFGEFKSLTSLLLKN